MNKTIAIFALCVGAALPVAAAAQPGSPTGGGYGPSPEVRARFERIRADAKTSAYNALSPDHRSRVQAIVDRVTGGQLRMRDAADQIDAVLSPDEKTAVAETARKARESIRSTMQANAGDGGPRPDGPPRADGGPRPDGGPGADGAHPDGPRPDGGRRGIDAGRVLLMFSLTPEQMRAARPRPSAAP